MKTFNQLSKPEQQIIIDSNSLRYLTVDDLKKYKECVDKFLMQETKDIIDWLIVNNSTYMSELPGSDYNDNPLVGFYNYGKPGQKHFKELWDKIDAVVKNGRTLEIPTLLTKEQFDNIVNNKISLDKIVLDLTSERSRNELTKKYQPLIWKIVNQWNSKTVMNKEDLYSAALEGFVCALNTYGEKSKKRIKREEHLSDKEIKEYEKKLNSSMTFGQYAAYMIRVFITEAIKDLSRTVRIPRSVQQREKKITGSIKAVNTISGDSVATTSKDGNTKTMFDFMGSSENTAKNIDKEDLDNLWKKVYDKLEKVFDKKIMDIWYSYNGLNGYEKIGNKKLAQKYNVVSSNITYYISKVNTYIRNNKTIYNAMKDIYELMKECLHDIDDDNDYDVIYIPMINDNDIDENDY